MSLEDLQKDENIIEENKNVKYWKKLNIEINLKNKKFLMII